MPRLKELVSGKEDGQILVLFALSLVVVLGFSALAIDVGFWLHTRTKLQADVDAMALAGAQELCSPYCAVERRPASEASASSIAQTFGQKNNVKPDEIAEIRFDRDCNGDVVPDRDQITVEAVRSSGTYLGRVLGITEANIVACASAAGGYGVATASTVGGFGHGVRPFALERQCIEEGPTWPAIKLGDLVILKFDSDGKGTCETNQGNFAAIRVDGSGASVYEETIKYGSTSPLCADSTPGCCPTANSAGCTGSYGVYLTPTETGNMIGATKKGIDLLMTGTPSSCNTWNEVQTDGVINPDCAPWNPSYSPSECALDLTKCTPTRLLIVPIVDGLWDGGGNNIVTIKRFAVVFLEGYDGGKCSGNQCDIKARFIKAEVSFDWVSANIPCDDDQPTCDNEWVTTTIARDGKLIQ